ncbi:MAG: hypothetical protein QOI51_2070 [Nocardioidaceae bacterium]|nr:hypothetical protein [Nocardioidaceae bacterium]
MKRTIGTLLCVLLFTPLALIMPSASAGDGCSVVKHNGDPRHYWSNCHNGENHPGEGPLGPTGGGGDGRYYEYVWLPTCPNALPGTPGAEQADCRAAHSCSNPRLTSQSLWGQLYDRSGQVVLPWHYLTSDCRDPQQVGPTKKRALSWADVRSAIRKIGVPRNMVQGPDYTLVNLRTTFYTSARNVERTLTIVGFKVDVEITPSRYIWHWGDGATTITSMPGRPYPARDITHTYVHATAPGVGLPLRVDVAYTARFRVDGGDWVPVTDELVVRGISRQLPVKQASAVLVPSS